MDRKIKFLGQGWGFPPSFDRKNARVNMVSGREDIEQSIEILLGTIKGERVLRPDYGSNMDEMVFAFFDESMKTYLKNAVETALLYHEPRIEPQRIEIDDRDIHEGRINIEIEYKISATNSRFNMVYPFYINEATDS